MTLGIAYSTRLHPTAKTRCHARGNGIEPNQSLRQRLRGCFHLSIVLTASGSAVALGAMIENLLRRAGTLAASPFHAFDAGSCKARAYEKLTCHGWGPMAFIALRCSVALSALWPPDKNAIPGTAAGTVRLKQRSVRSATSSTPACLGLSFPDTTMLGLRIIPSR